MTTIGPYLIDFTKPSSNVGFDPHKGEAQSTCYDSAVQIGAAMQRDGYWVRIRVWNTKAEEYSEVMLPV